jgi:hypothetical protein
MSLEAPFDASIICSGKSVKYKKVTYTGHAVAIESVDQAINILDFIGSQTYSEDSLPFAIRMKSDKDGEIIQIAEDNGEFSCGQALEECLNKYSKIDNVLICVSRQTINCFVTDRIQAQKRYLIMEAANAALESLNISGTLSTPAPHELVRG